MDILRGDEVERVCARTMLQRKREIKTLVFCLGKYVNGKWNNGIMDGGVSLTYIFMYTNYIVKRERVVIQIN